MMPVNEKADLTVAIATKDRPDRLLRCLTALFNGDLLPGEVVLVDQSSDPLQPEMQAWLDRAPVPLQYIRQDACGLSASRNQAAACARFLTIAFTDDDCVPDPGWVRAIWQTFAGENPPAAVSGRVLPLGPEKAGTFPVSLREGRERQDYQGKQIPWQVGTGGNFAIQQTWLLAAGLFDERFGAGSPGKSCEDSDLIYRLLGQGAVIRYEPDMVIYHERQSRGQRLSSRFSYAYGIGAFCALNLQRGDGFALRILLTWLARLARELGGAALHGQWQRVEERWFSLKGMLPGLLYGIRLHKNSAPKGNAP